MTLDSEVFLVPIQDNFLLYAPLHQTAALIDAAAADQLKARLNDETAPIAPVLAALYQKLAYPVSESPQARKGPLTDPFFLGLIPTRDCNMSCVYCDFGGTKKPTGNMPLIVAREAVDAYVDVLLENGHSCGEVHFFGGEPFYAEEVVHFVVHYATMKAIASGIEIRFEATSNGLYNRKRAYWIADYFDTIVLSLDGTAENQDKNRPGLNGKSVFDTVVRSAQIFSERSIELILRTCVTANSVSRLPEFAVWISERFRPSTWCVETLTESPLNEAVQLEPPDPWEFARYFHQAADILEPYGIAMVNSTTNFSDIQHTLCPVGRDALIVSPDGAIDACYLMVEDWSRNGLNMRFGQLKSHNSEANKRNGKVHIDIDQEALDGIRQLNVHNYPLCSDCLCRFHCAGGCHVNHKRSAIPGNYDAICIQTRAITIASILKQLGQHALAGKWLGDRPALETSVWQKSDRAVKREWDL